MDTEKLTALLEQQHAEITEIRVLCEQLFDKIKKLESALNYLTGKQDDSK